MADGDFFFKTIIAKEILMKKLLLFSIALGFSVMGVSANAAKAPQRAPQLNESTLKWNPTKVNQYSENWEMPGEWTLGQTTDYTYNEAGEVATETTLSVDGIYGNKTEYAYDTVDPSLCIAKTTYSLENGTWVKQEWNTESITITRNADGNIEKAVKTENGYTYTMVVTFGADKRPSAINITEYNETDGESFCVYSDLVWNSFAGNFMIFEDMDAMVDYIPTSNSLKSGKCTNTRNNTVREIQTITVDKISDKSYKYEFVENDARDGEWEVRNYTLTLTDDYGSFVNEGTERQWEEATPDDVSTYAYKETAAYDKFGLLLSAAQEESDYSYRRSYEVTYDPTTGLPATYTGEGNRYTFEGGKAGITNVVSDENAPVEYYNLQGVRVANPDGGIYIRRQGNKTSKIMIR